MHKCSKHVEAWNKLIVKQKFCASSWLITKIDGIYLFIYFYSVFLAFMIILTHICVSNTCDTAQLLTYDLLKTFAELLECIFLVNY